MDPVFRNFLEGLLQKDPKRRMAWPHLLYHPFVSDGKQEAHISLHVHALPSGIDIPHLMECAHRGRLEASCRISECRTHPLPTGPAQQSSSQDVALVGSLLRDRAVLDREGVATLAAHLRGCCAGQVGPSELTATLRAAQVLVEDKQVWAMVGSGLPLWLLETAQELAALKKADLLGHTVGLLTQAISVLLVALVEGLFPW